MNKLWTILHKGSVSNMDLLFARKTDPSEYTEKKSIKDAVDILYTKKGEEYRNYIRERIVQICFNGPLSNMFKEVDPLNTYSFPFTMLDNGFDVLETDLPMVVHTNIGLEETDWIQKELVYNITKYSDIEGVANILDGSFTPVTFIMTNGLSSIITYNDFLYVHLRGTLSTDFKFTANVINVPIFNIDDILNRITIQNDYFQTDELFETWQHGNAIEKLSAYVYNLFLL